jgi:hypothetical protein
MRNLILILLCCLAIQLSAQKPYCTSLNAGVDIFDTHNILYSVPGEYRGVKTDHNFSQGYRVGFAPEWRWNHSRLAASATLFFVPYSENVFRYQLYYSPAGNPYGGYVFNHYEGNYKFFELALRYTQVVYDRENFRGGLLAGIAVAKELSHDYGVASLSAGLMLEKPIGGFEYALSPQIVLYPLESKDYFSLVGGRIEFSVRIPNHTHIVK